MKNESNFFYWILESNLVSVSLSSWIRWMYLYTMWFGERDGKNKVDDKEDQKGVLKN